jgi:hypothetical protein
VSKGVIHQKKLPLYFGGYDEDTIKEQKMIMSR